MRGRRQEEKKRNRVSESEEGKKREGKKSKKQIGIVLFLSSNLSLWNRFLSI